MDDQSRSIIRNVKGPGMSTPYLPNSALSVSLAPSLCVKRKQGKAEGICTKGGR